MLDRFNLRSSGGISGFLLQNGGMLTYLILGVALTGFEMFNFSTTQYSLGDLLGPLQFFGIPWATILAIAFCGIDFAGIGRLFLPDGADSPGQDTWYLFGAWLLAATMNAILTWWGVSMALEGHTLQSTEIMDPKLIMQAVPIFVAIMVWVTRVLLIGSFAKASRHTQVPMNRYAAQRPTPQYRPSPSQSAAAHSYRSPTTSNPRAAASIPTHRPTPLPMSSPMPSVQSRTILPTPLEPEYIPDGDTPTSVTASIPALRPLAISARPPSASGNQDRKF